MSESGFSLINNSYSCRITIKMASQPCDGIMPNNLTQCVYSELILCKITHYYRHVYCQFSPVLCYKGAGVNINLDTFRIAGSR